MLYNLMLQNKENLVPSLTFDATWNPDHLVAGSYLDKSKLTLSENTHEPITLAGNTNQ